MTKTHKVLKWVKSVYHHYLMFQSDRLVLTLTAVAVYSFRSSIILLCCCLPCTSWSLRPTCPVLGSACASGRWCRPCRHRGSCSEPDQSQTPACTAAAARLKISLGTAWSGTLKWTHEIVIILKTLFGLCHIQRGISFLYFFYLSSYQS